MKLSERKQYFSIFNIFQCKKINMAWCKKNKYHLQKPEKKKISLSNGKYTKTVTQSSSWSPANSSASLLRKNKISSQVSKSRKQEILNKYFDLLNNNTENYQVQGLQFIYLVDVCGLPAGKK